ncbi:helix-turn-helix transcriptional regulator [Bradyrhizobium manausense]|uniref:helix-turn-helix domain-containing protein n=1 Tax=Bradyrhizobium manausense TaxID=989370 RepID=UPI001BAE0911|nr:helix-turn-helix transcriptional regulator [Bradyrhizobium manausense]MBR0684454.1 helix-turn-helix transcriptional regulator [Bradyrhizobium manausense]
MRETGASQSDVAEACGVTQPHISKVLNGKIKLAKKTAAGLEQWLDENRQAQEPSPQTLEAIAAKLNALGPKRRMQFMQLLAAIDGLLGR